MKTLNIPRPSATEALRFLAFIGACAGLVALAVAQTTPVAPPTTTPQTTQPTGQGWLFFDDATGRALDLDEATMSDLRVLDDNYRKRYEALGTTPWTAPGYDALTTEREQRIQGVLTPEQYDRWSGRYGSKRPVQRGTVPNNTPHE